MFTNLVETDMLWGHRNDPVNFHRCLQDFDRRLPGLLLDALREGDLLILTLDHGCDPTTPSTDHSREYALLLAYVQGRNAAGRVYEDGEFADVGATVNAWLGGALIRRAECWAQAVPRAVIFGCRADSAKAGRRRSSEATRSPKLDPRVRAPRGAGLPDGRVLHGRLLPGLTSRETFALTELRSERGETA